MARTRPSTGHEPPRSGGTGSGSARSYHSGDHEYEHLASLRSNVEDSVGQLLVVTKKLLETMSEWFSTGGNGDAVRSKYNSLTQSLDQVCNEFTELNVETQELEALANKLKSTLDTVLNTDASTQNLQNHLPTIRSIIIPMLHKIKDMRHEVQNMTTHAPVPASSKSISAQSWQSHYSAPTGFGLKSELEPRTYQAYEPHPSQASPEADSPLSRLGPSSMSSRRASLRLKTRVPNGGAGLNSSTGLVEQGSAAKLRGGPYASPETHRSETLSILESAPRQSPGGGSSIDRASHSAMVPNGRRSGVYLSRGNGAGGAQIPGVGRVSPLAQTSPGSSSGKSSSSARNATQRRQLHESYAAGIKSPTATTPNGGSVPSSAQSYSLPQAIYLTSGESTRRVELSEARVETLTAGDLHGLFATEFGLEIDGGREERGVIYIRNRDDPVPYELVNLKDLKLGSILSIKAAKPEESKLASEIQNLAGSINTMQAALLEQKQSIADVSISQTELKKQITTLSQSSTPLKLDSAPLRTAESLPKSRDGVKAVATTTTTTLEPSTRAQAVPVHQVHQIQGLVAVLKDSFKNKMGTIESDMAAAVSMMAKLKDQAALTRPGLFDGRGTEDFGRFVSECEAFVAEVDDLQDLMDSMCQDVAERRIRLPNKLIVETGKKIEKAQERVRAMRVQLDDREPHWKTVWMRAVETVQQEQFQLSFTRDIVSDLGEDITQVVNLFDKIQKTTNILNEHSANQSRGIAPLRPFTIGTARDPADMHTVRMQVLDQISRSADSEESQKRLAAIHRLERQRDAMTPEQSPFQEAIQRAADDKSSRTPSVTEMIDQKTDKRNRQAVYESLQLDAAMAARQEAGLPDMDLPSGLSPDPVSGVAAWPAGPDDEQDLIGSAGLVESPGPVESTSPTESGSVILTPHSTDELSLVHTPESPTPAPILTEKPAEQPAEKPVAATVEKPSAQLDPGAGPAERNAYM